MSTPDDAAGSGPEDAAGTRSGMEDAAGMRSGLRFVPTCLAVAAVIAVGAVPIGWFTHGTDGATGAAAGVAVMALAYLMSAVVIVWVDAVDRKLLLPIVMLTYVLKIVALGVVGYTAKQAGWEGLPAMAVSAGVVIILWPLAQLWWTLRSGRSTSEYAPSQAGGAARSSRSIA
ncbi:MAG: hypothetical protein ACRDUA_02465 [Micromonosporaceae bacterium]